MTMDDNDKKDFIDLDLEDDTPSQQQADENGEFAEAEYTEEGEYTEETEGEFQPEYEGQIVGRIDDLAEENLGDIDAELTAQALGGRRVAGGRKKKGGGFFVPLLILLIAGGASVFIVMNPSILTGGNGQPKPRSTPATDLQVVDNTTPSITGEQPVPAPTPAADMAAPAVTPTPDPFAVPPAPADMAAAPAPVPAPAPTPTPDVPQPQPVVNTPETTAEVAAIPAAPENVPSPPALGDAPVPTPPPVETPVATQMPEVPDAAAPAFPEVAANDGGASLTALPEAKAPAQPVAAPSLPAVEPPQIGPQPVTAPPAAAQASSGDIPTDTMTSAPTSMPAVPPAPTASITPPAAPSANVAPIQPLPTTDMTAAPAPENAPGEFYDSKTEIKPAVQKTTRPQYLEVHKSSDVATETTADAPAAPADDMAGAGESIDNLLISAQRALKLDRYDAALDIFEQLYARNARDPRILMGRAVAYQKTGKPDQALRSYEELLAIDPNNSDAMVNMLGLLRSQYPEVALRRLMDLSKRYPSNPAIAAQIGVAQADMGNFQDAVTFLNLAAKLDPKNAQHLFNLAVIYDRMGDKKNAISNYESALETDTVYGGARTLPREQIYDRLSVLRR